MRGTVIALVLLAGCTMLGPPPMEPLTAATLEEALARWQARGAGSYRLVVQVRPPRLRPEVYEVVVMDGTPVRIARDGDAVRPEDIADDDYSVSGLFRLLEWDLRWNDVEAVGDTPAIDLRARFEPETGRPISYRRTVGTGKRRVLFIEVLAYEPLETPCLASTQPGRPSARGATRIGAYRTAKSTNADAHTSPAAISTLSAARPFINAATTRNAAPTCTRP